MKTEWEEDSLEPVNWDSAKEIGKKMIEDIFNYIENIEKEKVWKPMSNAAIRKFKLPIPMETQALEQCYEEFLQDILTPHSPMNIHPGFWGWVMGSGNPVGVLAEMLAAGLNSNVIGGTQVPCKVEEQVLQWFKELFGFSEESSGILTSGCSEANLIALAVARNNIENATIRKQGLQNSSKHMIFYTSEERHHSIDKAIELLGIGSENIRLLPVDDQFRVSIDALEEAIKNDREKGFYPLCVIGNVGTVNTGAIDDISKLAEVARQENLWLHIDGAFGALACLSEKYRDLTEVLSLADSLAFDLHKWMYMPYSVGCVLFKDKTKHFQTFAAEADYIKHRGVWFSDYGMGLSRGFSALKVWMCLKAYGIKKFGQLIEADIKKASYLAELVRDKSDLELLAPVNLNIVCFRYKGEHKEDEKINGINKRIVMLLQSGGEVFPSETYIGNKYAIRVSITNYRTQKENLDLLIKRVLELGVKIS